MSSFYDVSRKYFVLSSLVISPITFVMDAPFGRFTPKDQSSVFLVDGIKSWIVMELVAPTSFLYSLLSSTTHPRLFSPQTVIASLYLLHYLNRAILSPLRTPSRSRSHISVPLSGIFFNTINGFLLGTYIASPTAHTYLINASTRPSFWIGITLWALGAAGNIWHDEILLNIRRNARSKGKARDGDGTEHYSIPQGGLYSLVSYPNYLCEWIEWAGFALAAAPIPFPTLSLNPFSPFEALKAVIQAPASSFAPMLTPPYIFLLNEVLLMLPRAVRGHKWYHSRFGASYPAERRAVIPFLI